MEQQAVTAKVNTDECTGCGECVEICPVEAIKIENAKAIIGDECIECGACLNECPNNALSL
jgi:ferredoxin